MSRRVPKQHSSFCSGRISSVLLPYYTILSALCLNYLKAISCTLTHAHTVFTHVKLVVRATVSQLPGMIYITMVTLACSPLELVRSDELELHSICIPFTASVSQWPLGMLDWVEASLIHHMCIRTGACFSLFTPLQPFFRVQLVPQKAQKKPRVPLG